MSAINTKIKTFILTAISAAILSACGGGGGGGNAALSTGSTNTAGSSSPEKNGGAGNNNNANTGNANNNNSTAQTPTLSNKADKLEELKDEAPLSPLNQDTPLHTHVISSESAQQGNPNVQLRMKRNNDATEYTGGYYQTDSQENDQHGLISSLNFKQDGSVKTDELKLDAVVIANRRNEGKATQAEWPSASSLIVKAFSEDATPPTFSNPNDPLNSNYRDLVYSDISKLAYFQKGNLSSGDGKNVVFDKRFDGVYVIQFTDGTQIVMHDPAAAGWAYQTFAFYKDPKNDVAFGYQSLGDETKFTALPASGTATYNGLTTAYVVKNNDQSRQLTADVKAIVDFGLKGVRFETTNSQFHSLDANGRRVTVKGADYDMKGTAKWENGNLFLGKVEATAAGLKGNLSGKFFGPSAAEIGGTYGLKKEDGSEHMIGGYGAKRQ
ncbi:transferrin-binding protein-like solute binding protein [Neisseria sp.]